ncbi:hypothetical protein [uncultured Endozoicomonas sp.]|uniref:hypothetical protein n=1 Tax=uncultured Endozoicomonas sp. TaxID=432652 RepID=UPI00260DBD5B|nr:hypothetical protein [uncultured Endozoicomonas sp.]
MKIKKNDSMIEVYNNVNDNLRNNSVMNRGRTVRQIHSEVKVKSKINDSIFALKRILKNRKIDSLDQAVGLIKKLGKKKIDKNKDELNECVKWMVVEKIMSSNELKDISSIFGDEAAEKILQELSYSTPFRLSATIDQITGGEKLSEVVQGFEDILKVHKK